MSVNDTERRAPTAPELLRDFEVIVNDRLTEERLRRRRSERVSRMAVGLAVAALALSLFMGFAMFGGSGPGISAGVVRTSEIRLVDGAGRTRGRWVVQEDGTVRLAILDPQSTERLRLTLFDNGALGISLADARGQGRVVLSLEGAEGSRLTLADAAGTPRAMLGLSPQSAGTLLFADERGAPRSAIGLESDGRAVFLLPDDRARDTSPPDTTPGAPR